MTNVSARYDLFVGAAFYTRGFCDKLCVLFGTDDKINFFHSGAIMANGKKPTTKSEIYAYISEKTGLKRKDVVNVFDCLGELIERDLKKGPGIFNVVGLMKVKLVHKPAVPARKGINPFTKEEVMFKAKPARNVVKIQALKTLKDMV